MIWTLIIFGWLAICGYIWNGLVTQRKDANGHAPTGNKTLAIIACILTFLIASAMAEPFLPSDEEDAAIDYYYDPQ